MSDASQKADALQEARDNAERTYNAAADCFDAAPLSFWERYGRRTVERMKLRKGARVLDVCCGSGASALPAARAVGKRGSVIAIDVAEELLHLGRIKASVAQLENVEFERADMTSLGHADARFDAIICGFGIFLVPDMEAQVAELWRMVARNGQLAITTWGRNFWAPVYEIWLSNLRRIRPDLHTSFNPWDRITTVDAVRKLMHDGGVTEARVEEEDGFQELRFAEDFWTIAKGSGLRWAIEQMTQDEADELKRCVLAEIEIHRADQIETNVIYALARKS